MAGENAGTDRDVEAGLGQGLPGAVELSRVDVLDEHACRGSEEGRRCPLVDGADVVVTSPSLAEAHEILAAYDRLGVRPIVVDATEVDIDELAEVAGGAVFLPPPLAAQSLRLAVSEASAYLDV